MSDQTTFAAALLDPDHPVPPNLLDGHGNPAGRRFAVYRNNVVTSLIDALETGFPVIAKLVGPTNFRNMARIFLRDNPPQSPLMMHYGAPFPAFVKSFEPVQHLGYLHDIARLELALRRSYHAADMAPINPDFFASMAPDALPHLRLRFAPAVEILRSDWPIYGIWTYNTHDNAEKPAPIAQDILITRLEFDPLPHLLPPGGATFLHALQSGAPMETALGVVENHTDFDLSALLTLLLQTGAITHATLEDPQ